MTCVQRRADSFPNHWYFFLSLSLSLFPLLSPYLYLCPSLPPSVAKRNALSCPNKMNSSSGAAISQLHVLWCIGTRVTRFSPARGAGKSSSSLQQFSLFPWNKSLRCYARLQREGAVLFSSPIGTSNLKVGQPVLHGTCFAIRKLQLEKDTFAAFKYAIDSSAGAWNILPNSK